MFKGPRRYRINKEKIEYCTWIWIDSSGVSSIGFPSTGDCKVGKRYFECYTKIENALMLKQNFMNAGIFKHLCTHLTKFPKDQRLHHKHHTKLNWKMYCINHKRTVRSKVPEMWHLSQWCRPNAVKRPVNDKEPVS